MENPGRQRWLILTSSTGSGHDMRAYALREWAERELGDNVEIDVYHALEQGSPLGKFGVDTYNWIQRHGPWMHNIYWFIAEAFGLLNGCGVGIARGIWREKLTAFQPHLVISMHDSLNRGYFAEARKTLGETHVRCVTYCGEWSGGFGFSRNWIDAAADRIYVRVPATRDHVIGKGYPAERVRVFCNLLHPRDFEPPLSAADRRDYRERKLGLDPDRFTVFLATGALGADAHIDFLNALHALHERLQVIVVSGRNGLAFDRIGKWHDTHPELRLVREGFSRRMHRLMQVSDCLVTRGGANTMAEALYFQCPVLFHANNGLMPQERCTLRFLETHRIGTRIRRPAELARVINHWMDYPEEYEALRQRLAAIASRDRPPTLVRELAALAGESEPA